MMAVKPSPKGAPNNRTRPTQFTSLIAVSTKSTLSAIRRDKHLQESFHSIRVTPRHVLIKDYEPNVCQSRTIKLTNLTRRVQRIAIQPPTTGAFRVKELETGWILVAPGLDVSVVVEFSAEWASKKSSGAGDGVDAFVDRLRVVVEEGQDIDVKLEAYPAGPHLEADEEVDFGTLIAKKEMGLEDGWITRYVEVRNTGKRRAQISCTWDSKIPIRVTPSSITLAAPQEALAQPQPASRVTTATRPLLSSCSLRIDFYPHIVGKLLDTVKIKLDSDVPKPNSELKADTEIAVRLKATVIDHKLRFRNAGNTITLDPGNIDFGTIYYAQSAGIPVRLENRGPTPVRWVITHTGESKPMVFSQILLETANTSTDDTAADNASEDADLRASMSVYPSEGTLEPYQSVPIEFAFSPRLPTPSRGFKSSLQSPLPRAYKVPMELKIVNSSAHPYVREGEESVPITLTGRACPIRAVLQPRTIEFAATPQGQQNVTEAVLRNNGENMSFHFRFLSVAHFHAVPTVGTLRPGEEVLVRVSFKPNQLGDFHCSMPCLIESIGPHARDSTEVGSVGLVRLEGDKLVEKLAITLHGVCASKVSVDSYLARFRAQPENQFHSKTNSGSKDDVDGLPDHDTEFADWGTVTGRGTMSKFSSLDCLSEQPSPLKTNPEWEQKVAHRKHYTDHLRQCRAERVRRMRICRLGDDGVAIDPNKLNSTENYGSFDRENGLVAPEPIDCPDTESDEGELRKSNNKRSSHLRSDDSQHTNNDPRKLRALFQKLLTPTSTKAKSVSPMLPPSTAAASTFDIPLSGADLANIFTAHSLIDFGNITTHSINITPLNFLNATPGRHPIHISILDLDDQLSNDESNGVVVMPQHLVIPPMSVGGFEVRVCSHEPGIIEKKITYLINGRYKYSIPVKVEVTPVALELSTDTVDINVEMRETTAIPSASAEVKVINKGNYGAGFQWIIPDSDQSAEFDATRMEGCFAVEPASGFVGPESNMKVRITYLPGVRPTREDTLQLQVFHEFEGEKTITQTLSLRCKGSIPPATCSLLTSIKQGPLNLGILPVGYADNAEGGLQRWNAVYPTIFSLSQQSGSTPDTPWGKASIRIKNTSGHPAIFSARKEQIASEVSIVPASGSIAPSGTLEFTLQALPTHPGTVEDVILITVIGSGRIIRLPFKYDARIPDVDVEFQGGDMGKGTIIGSTGFKRMALTNKASVPAGVVVDLTNHPDFELRIRDNLAASRKASAPRARTTSGRHRRVRETESPTKQGHLIRALGPSHPLYATLGAREDMHGRLDESQGKGRIYLVEVPPTETISVDISFRPTIVKKHSFDLPIYIIGSAQTPTTHVDAEGIASPLAVSKSSINFKNRVVHRDQGPNSVSHLRIAAKETITLTNTSKRSMEWWFDLDSLDDSEKVFKIEPWRGILGPGEAHPVTISFYPETTGLFEAAVPLHLDYLGPKPLLSLPLQGTGVEPSLAFDPPELFLPIVPRATEAMAVFSIINYGCERTEVRETIPEELRGMVELVFPEGKLLKSDGEKLTIVAKFICQEGQPATFMAKFEFSNDGRRAFYLPVHGTSDGSLLSLQPFFWLNKEEKKPVENLTENQKRNRILTGPRPFKTPCGIPLESGLNLQSVDKFYSDFGETLLRWLEDHLGAMEPWRSFPEQLTASNGKILSDLVQSLSGKKPPTSPSSATPGGSSPEERTKALYKQYCDILTHLTSLGALLSAVKPEFLMTFEDYKMIIQWRIEQMKTDVGSSLHDEYHEYNRKLEHHFPLISKEAWCTLIAQVVRVYVTLLVTPRHFRSLPGVGKDEAEMVWQGTPKGTDCEGVLLRWAAYHFWKSTGTPKAFKNFTTDFQSILPFAYIIQSHLPNMSVTHFSTLHPDPTTTEQLLHNASLVANALLDLLPGCTASCMSVERISKGQSNGVDAFLLTLFLYQILPNFIPKSLVEFHGALHEHITRDIELVNPTFRSLTYVPDLQGSDEFLLRDLTNGAISIGPKGTATLSIEFVSKFFRSVQGSLVLRSRRMGLNSGSVLVFELKSAVKEAAPKRVIKIDGVMYGVPPTVVNVEVVNPLNVKGRFAITVKQTKGASQQAIPSSFRTSTDELALEAHQLATIQITFLPFELGTHDCILHFFDPNAGEFSYQVIGRGLPPPPMETFLWTSKAGDTLEKGIRIAPVNQAKEKAVQFLLGSPKTRAPKAKGSIKERGEEGKEETAGVARRPIRFKVECSSPFFRGPNEIVVKPAIDPSKEKKHIAALEQSYTELPITFNPRGPGKYSCRVTLTSLDSSDVRIFTVNGLAISEGSRAALEFSIPARQTVSQEIPIVNRTDEDWTIKAHIQGPKTFTGPYTVTARAHSTTPYSITFAPSKAGESHALLTLSNLQTAQKHLYQLRGVGMDPLPEERREVECQARDLVTQRFKVHNPHDQDAEYDVTTDIPYASGPKSLRIGAGQAVEYELTIAARCSGKFVSNITFTNRVDKSFVWYIVSLQIQAPPPEGTLRVSTTVRQPVQVEIPLINPLDHPITYTAEITGTGLVGDENVTIGSNEELSYSLSFEPMLRMKAPGTIKFFNEEIGEFWYQLKLEAEEAPPVELPEMSCALGKCCFQLLPLVNPLNRPIILAISLSNTRDFALHHPPIDLGGITRGEAASRMSQGRSSLNVSLGPLEATEIQLVFWPSSLTEKRKGSVEIVSLDVGNFVFWVEGRGHLPTSYDPTFITSFLHEPTTSSITFTNPLVDPIPVSITLDQDAETPDFSLIHRQKRVHVGGMEDLDIPFVYKPEKMLGKEMKIIVAMEGTGGLKWVFPVKGIPERTISLTPYTFETRTREAITKDIDLTLKDFIPIHAPSPMDFTYAFEETPNPLLAPTDKSLESDARESLNMRLEDVKMGEGETIVKFKAIYTPSRPFTHSLHLCLKHTPSSSFWRLPLRLISHPPSLDDTITIEGTLNKLSCVSFRITSKANRDRHFKAYFVEQDKGFVVLPQAGVLVPEERMGEKDNSLVVGYRAREYGKTVVGVLVVECEDVSWTFEIRGITPGTPPTHTTSRASSSRTTSTHPRKRNPPFAPRRNFIRENSLNPVVMQASGG
ncbi:uncharacterized protein SPPG_07686 [Spizellomyces punctatus DAOM BR117]|uniref:Calponin-homology (CH) domain-containing protein n=1 Tax=Spizellomyces punctatus (strain DAOM BR117) TaxID=645134 RepID=A0A0L0H7A1_SPIPD|nr:uncharacterized protein SPPG_07686 [Spizellomyces punctatus DAOM BR117]KNC96854.1 hypothetical protein SPPG_07686 [Spizellomyces punctatus DAOM BR117]|eukprot:XP_016604894.1 hypothetical protein SPPG_07686 [Spizellomyces punctatus DAOM BR117]